MIACSIDNLEEGEKDEADGCILSSVRVTPILYDLESREITPKEPLPSLDSLPIPLDESVNSVLAGRECEVVFSILSSLQVTVALASKVRTGANLKLPFGRTLSLMDVVKS
jgi:hypothetical protein